MSEEKEVPMVSSWSSRESVGAEKSNPPMMGLDEVRREFDLATAGVATAGIAATQFIPHYVDKRFALNWWQDLLVSAGVAVGGTIAVDNFMSRRYSRIFFWTATGAVIVKAVRTLLERQGLYGLSSGYQAGQYERERYGFSGISDEFDFGLDEFDDDLFGVSQELPMPPADDIIPTTVGDVHFGI